MPNYCFLCASNEGVLLNFTSNNIKTIRKQVETCLSPEACEKVNESNRICYKCAYELNECNTFVEKYKKCRVKAKYHSKCTIKKQCCSLCHESVKSGYTFNITKDHHHPLNDSLFKIQKLFNEDLFQSNTESVIICLSCRYNLDLLFDLKCIYQEIAEKLNNDQEVDYLTLSKISTVVVKRRTTTSEFIKVRAFVCTDSDSDSTMKTRGRVNIKKHSNNSPSLEKKSRVCDKCHISVKSGMDMYRFHKTGWIVCKECWITIDPSVCSLNQDLQNSLDSKICSVFLKDVLIDKSIKDQNLYRIEKDSQGNPIYIITNKNESEVNCKSPKHLSHTQQDDISVKKGSKRTAKFNSDNESDIKKKLRSNVPRVQEKSNKFRTMSDKKDSYSDTDILSLRKTNSNIVKQKRKPVSPSSDVESQRRRRTKRRKTSLKRLKKTQFTMISEESSSSEDVFGKKHKIVQSECKRDHKFSLFSTNKGKSTSEFKAPILKKSSLLSTSKSKSPNKDEILIAMKEEIPEEKYTCNECGIKNYSKLSAATHELTHFKQLTLKLHKVGIPDKINEDTQTNESHEMDVPNETRPSEIETQCNTDESREMNISSRLQVEEKNQENTEETNQRVDLSVHENKTSDKEAELENNTVNEKDVSMSKESEIFKELNKSTETLKESKFEDSEKMFVMGGEKKGGEEENQEDASLKLVVSDKEDSCENTKSQCEIEKNICTTINDHNSDNSSNINFKNRIYESCVDETCDLEEKTEGDNEKVQEQVDVVAPMEINLDNEEQRNLSAGENLTSDNINETNEKRNEDLSILEQNDAQDKDAESEIDIKIVDTDSSEGSIEADFNTSHTVPIEEDKQQNLILQIEEQENVLHQNASSHSTKIEDTNSFDSNNDTLLSKDKKQQNSKSEQCGELHESMKGIEEGIDHSPTIGDDDTCKDRDKLDEMETKDGEGKSDISQNISSEINSNADMPSLEDPIVTTEISNDKESSHEV